MAGASGKKLDETYKLAWLRGLKTTYYLRTMGATHAEKSTVNAGSLNAVPTGSGMSGAMSGAMTGGATAMSALEAAAAQAQQQMDNTPGSDIKFCSIDNPDCEACQ